MRRSVVIWGAALLGSAGCGSVGHRDETPAGAAGQASSAAGQASNVAGQASSVAGQASSAAGQASSAGTAGNAGRPSSGPSGTPPALVPGRWTEITPPIPYLLDAAHAGIISFAIDPSAPDTLYVGIEGPGLIRSTDRGATWTALGASDPDPYDDESTFLDLPISIAVDPVDSSHLYVTEGVRGAGNGVWVSHDAGASWRRKKSDDLTSRAIDPLDFNHVLVGTHDFMPSLFETKDGGDTWTSIPVPFGDGGSFGVRMLFDPGTSQGDNRTWLLHGPGHWRTSDAGATWTRVSDIGAVHGGDAQFYGPNGVLYSGAWDGMALSHDNGATWERITQGIASGSFQTGVSDGTRLFTMQTNNWGTDVALLSSAASDGRTWQPYADGAQKFTLGANGLYLDATNHILYSTNMAAGLWALLLSDP